MNKSRYWDERREGRSRENKMTEKIKKSKNNDENRRVIPTKKRNDKKINKKGE